jgi:hypothetical protein
MKLLEGKSKIIAALFLSISFTNFGSQYKVNAIQSPSFQSGICEFDGPDKATEILRNLPNAVCSISVNKKFDSARYIVMAQEGHGPAIHWLWRSGPSYIAQVSPKSAKICKADSSDRRKIIGLKPGKCTVRFVTRKAERFTTIDNTNKGDSYSASVVIEFTK